MTETIPPTMRVAVLNGIRDVSVAERATPSPGSGEVLVRVTAVGVCGSDVHYYEHGRIGRYVVDAPLILGHEAGGYVASVGPDVKSIEVGQRVSIEPGIPCRSCAQCLGGRYNLCPDVNFFATPPHDGAFCEYVVMPEAFVYPVPDSVSDDAAGLIEPLSVGVWACRRANVAPGDRVLVTGAGPIGLIAAQTALAYGAKDVAITDVNSHRLQLAEALGIRAIDVSSVALGESAFEPSVLLECSGNQKATAAAVTSMARAGRVVLIGLGGDELQLPLGPVQDRELVITGSFRYANTWPTAIALAASDAIQLDPLVTAHFGLDQTEAALTSGHGDPHTVKVMVCP
jgi:L-iditol 2-dehydrogenase